MADIIALDPKPLQTEVSIWHNAKATGGHLDEVGNDVRKDGLAILFKRFNLFQQVTILWLGTLGTIILMNPWSPRGVRLSLCRPTCTARTCQTYLAKPNQDSSTCAVEEYVYFSEKDLSFPQVDAAFFFLKMR